jgi:DNA-binding NarL/FixJ family response regulator
MALVSRPHPVRCCPRQLPGPVRRTAPWLAGDYAGRVPPESQAAIGTQHCEGETDVSEAAADQPKIRVFLLDDHEIVRKGVRDLLEAEPDIEVVGEAGTAESALARIPALRPDVAVLDVRLPDGDGVSVCRDIRSQLPQTACLMLTSFGDDEALFDAIMAGAAGYVLKQIKGTDLVGAIRTVAAGHSLLDPQAASRVMERMRDRARASDPLAGLTEQERKILELIGEGLTNRQIGERMFLAEKTVKNYTSALFAKLGMERRTQAAAYAARVFDNPEDPKRGSGPSSHSR